MDSVKTQLHNCNSNDTIDGLVTENLMLKQVTHWMTLYKDSMKEQNRLLREMLSLRTELATLKASNKASGKLKKLPVSIL